MATADSSVKPDPATPTTNSLGLAHASRKSCLTSDDSFDGLPGGMSPPVLMSPARPPGSVMRREEVLRSAQARRMFGYPLRGDIEVGPWPVGNFLDELDELVNEHNERQPLIPLNTEQVDY